MTQKTFQDFKDDISRMATGMTEPNINLKAQKVAGNTPNMDGLAATIKIIVAKIVATNGRRSYLND